jgi:hypothetical protein
VLDGHEAEGGDAEVLEVVEHRGLGEAGVGASQRCGDCGVEFRLAFDVEFVEDSVA